MLNQIKQSLRLMKNPEKEFLVISKYTFERALSEYLKMLLALALVSGVVSFVYDFGKAFYLYFFQMVDINFNRMVNYSFGRTTSIIFLYFFLGTFILFIVSFLLFSFIRKIKYVKLLQILFYSLSPILLFSWIPTLTIALFVWAVFLFYVGIGVEKGSIIKKDSIQQRD